MPAFLPLSPLFLANLSCFLQSHLLLLLLLQKKKKKKDFSLCRCHVKNPHKQQEKLATSTQKPAQRLQSDCHTGSSLKKQGEK